MPVINFRGWSSGWHVCIKTLVPSQRVKGSSTLNIKSIRYMTFVYNKTGAAARLMDCTAKVRVHTIFQQFKLKAPILRFTSGDKTV